MKSPAHSIQHFADPVAAYDLLSYHYAGLSAGRAPYLRSVDKIIASRVSPGGRSLLDVGAGDGQRALKIASACGISRVVLLEPSRQMLSRVSGTAEIWNIRAEELRVQDRGPFDVILCLWNVLGHLLTIEDRRRAMHAIADQLSPEGSFFIDVNHRYNACAYGIIPTAARFLNDIFFRPETTGDVVARWDFGEHSISTHGHFFTHREIRQLVRSAGLKIENRIAVDYNNGRIRRFGFQGNLLYILRRASPIDSPSAAHTS